MNPRRRLDAFEEKHGDYYALLDAYCNASSAIDRLPTTVPVHSPGSRLHNALACEAAHVARGNARTLLRKHQELIRECIGYDQGYRDALRDFGAVATTLELDPAAIDKVMERLKTR